jgi:hypothetical protein
MGYRLFFALLLSAVLQRARGDRLLGHVAVTEQPSRGRRRPEERSAVGLGHTGALPLPAGAFDTLALQLDPNPRAREQTSASFTYSFTTYGRKDTSHNTGDVDGGSDMGDNNDKDDRAGRLQQVVTPHTPGALAPRAQPRNLSGLKGASPLRPSRRTTALKTPSSALPLGCVSQAVGTSHHPKTNPPGPRDAARTVVAHGYIHLSSISRAKGLAHVLMMSREAAQ